MRKLTDHIVERQAVELEIRVMDEPGQGGACHEYLINRPEGIAGLATLIKFQKGPIKEFGVNGITQEALLAIVIDRLKSFQKGPYACDDNHMALQHTQRGLYYLQERTRARLARGVEGTNQK